MKKSVQIFLAFLLSMVINVSFANPLQKYINSHCSKKCVDSVVLSEAVKQAAKQTKLKPETILAISQVESGFNTKAKSRTAFGLMQVSAKVHKSKFKDNNFYDVMQNVLVGASIYKDCLVKNNGNQSKAHVCYNGGGDRRYSKKVIEAENKISNFLKKNT